MKLKNVNGYWMIDDGQARSGVYSTVSWPRVVDALRKAGVVRDNEEVIGLEFDHNGLTFEVDTRE